MIVNYYEIKGCTLETKGGSRVLIAPDHVSPELLAKRDFSQAADGRFFHKLTDGEEAYIMSFEPGLPIIFETYEQAQSYTASDSPEKSRVLTVISLCLMAVQIVTLFGITHFSEGMLFFGCGCGIAAWICVIAARSNDKENRFARVVYRIYVVLAVLAFVVLFYLIVTCVSECDRCINECNHCRGMG